VSTSSTRVPGMRVVAARTVGIPSGGPESRAVDAGSVIAGPTGHPRLTRGARVAARAITL
jgi:hypothetical protein